MPSFGGSVGGDTTTILALEGTRHPMAPPWPGALGSFFRRNADSVHVGRGVKAAFRFTWLVLEDWGPPVQKIEVYLAPGQIEEGAGSKRKVYAKFSEKRKGWYQ